MKSNCFKKAEVFITVDITKTRLYNFDPFKPHFYIVCFEQKYEKYQIYLSENLPFLEVKVSIYLNRRVFIMIMLLSLQF